MYTTLPMYRLISQASPEPVPDVNKYDASKLPEIENEDETERDRGSTEDDLLI